MENSATTTLKLNLKQVKAFGIPAIYPGNIKNPTVFGLAQTSSKNQKKNILYSNWNRHICLCHWWKSSRWLQKARGNMWEKKIDDWGWVQQNLILSIARICRFDISPLSAYRQLTEWHRCVFFKSGGNTLMLYSEAVIPSYRWQFTACVATAALTERWLPICAKPPANTRSNKHRPVWAHSVCQALGHWTTRSTSWASVTIMTSNRNTRVCVICSRPLTSHCDCVDQQASAAVVTSCGRAALEKVTR